MRQFLEELFTTGELTVPGPGADFGPELFDDQIRLFDSAARAGMAHRAPDLDLETARWAATLLAWSVRLLLVRAYSEEHIAQVFAVPCPRARSASTPGVDYSADLFLRYFPGLVTLARRLAPADPLVDKIQAVLTEWPLSSVGMEGVAPAPVDSFIVHPGLRQLYADRILAAGASDRITHPLLAQTILVSIGAHTELSPDLAKTAQEIAASAAK